MTSQLALNPPVFKGRGVSGEGKAVCKDSLRTQPQVSVSAGTVLPEPPNYQAKHTNQMISLVLQLQAQDDTNRERPQEKGCKVSVGISQVSDDCRGSSGTQHQNQISRTRQRGFCTCLQCLGHIVHVCVFKRPFLRLQKSSHFQGSGCKFLPVSL